MLSFLGFSCGYERNPEVIWPVGCCSEAGLSSRTGLFQLVALECHLFLYVFDSLPVEFPFLQSWFVIPIRTTYPPDLLALFPHDFSEEVAP